ncbi:prephenate dehydrogenase/arogenate dehydrogenase family protein [soil metagenome]
MTPARPTAPIRPPRRVAVIGLGLIGGSLTRDLAAREIHVLGYDRDSATLRSAREAGHLRTALDASLKGLRDVDVVVLAVPVTAAPAVMEAALPHLSSTALITDVGSTKRAIVEAAERLKVAERFVGSHPLAGDHLSGWAASRSGLFHGARTYLCPTLHTTEETARLAEWLWTTVGAAPEWLSAAEHDRRLAWTSHLPQITATALALALDSAGITRADLGPGGRDTTRLAASSAEMWTAIARENRDNIAEAVAALEHRLRRFREALQGAETAEIHLHFLEGAAWAGR